MVVWSSFIWVSYEKPSSSYCVMLYFWWGYSRNLKLISLGSERVPGETALIETDIQVEPRHVELGYFELPAISNRIGFPLVLPLFYQSFATGYLELGYLKHPAISNCFSLPLAQFNPGYFELYLGRDSGVLL